MDLTTPISLTLGLIAVTAGAAFTQAGAFRRMYCYVEEELQVTAPNYTPKVTVIMPCKGLDPGFAKNISQLLSQDYCIEGTSKRNFEVIFAVATVEDPAYSVLVDLCAKHPDVPSKVVVAGLNARRAQKINNQLTALKQVSDDTEALVFVDSDMVARADFLRYLVLHLQDATVGATTGYRFYIPVKGDWPSLIRALWNRMSAWELASPLYSFAWGGAMAIRRETFDKAKIADHWDQSADDDLSLTCAVKDLGLRVRFVPQCLVASHGDATLEEVVEWTNRQLILTKVYYPQLWMRAIIRAWVLTAWLAAVLAALAVALATGNSSFWLAFAAGLTLMVVEGCFLVKAQGLWRRVLSFDRGTSEAEEKELREAFGKSLVRFATILPVAHLVLPWMTLYSLLTNRIRWRGVTYELRSPSEIVVV